MKSQIIPILREDSWQSALLVERTPAALRAVFFFLALLVSIASYLGYREIQQNRQMHERRARNSGPAAFPRRTANDGGSARDDGISDGN